MPTISIILPVYNVELFLDRCLASLIRQTYKDFEIIAVDDKSTDSSLSILYEWKERDNRLKIVENDENQGLSRVRNIGMKHAVGEYIYFLDSDDWLDPDYLEKMLAAGQMTKSPIIVNTSVKYHQLNGQVVQHYPKGTTAYPTNAEVNAQENALKLLWITPCHFWRLDFLRENSLGFPEGITQEDQFFQVAAYSFVEKVYIISNSSYHYWQNPLSICNTGSPGSNPNLIMSKRLYTWLEERSLLDTRRTRLFSEFIFPRKGDSGFWLGAFCDFINEAWPYLEKTRHLYTDEERVMLQYAKTSPAVWKSAQELSAELKKVRAAIAARIRR